MQCSEMKERNEDYRHTITQRALAKISSNMVSENFFK